MLAQLIPLEGGEPLELNNDITLVGRKSGVCDVVLDRGSVSKMHCLLVKTDGLLFIRDLGSTNGTKVNGQKITRGALLPGDELAFASVKFRVHLGPLPQRSPEDKVSTEMLTREDGLSAQRAADEAAADGPAGHDGVDVEVDAVADAASPPQESNNGNGQLQDIVPESSPDVVPVEPVESAGAEVIVPEQDEIAPEEPIVPEDAADSDSDVRLLTDDSSV